MRRTGNAREGHSGLDTIPANSGQRSEMARVVEVATGVSSPSAGVPARPAYGSFDALAGDGAKGADSPGGLRDGFGSGGKSSLGFCVQPTELLNQTGR